MHFYDPILFMLPACFPDDPERFGVSSPMNFRVFGFFEAYWSDGSCSFINLRTLGHLIVSSKSI